MTKVLCSWSCVRNNMYCYWQLHEVSTKCLKKPQLFYSVAQLWCERSSCCVNCVRFYVHFGERVVYVEQHSKYEQGPFGLGTDKLRIRETLPRPT